MSDDEKYEFLERKISFLEERKKDSDSRKTLDEVFDHPTLLTIYKLMCENVLNTVDFPISTGKEGNVFKATTKEGKAAAIKIYRISNLSFKTIAKYIIGDRRFKGVSNNRRKLMYQWTQKEYQNLDRMHTSGIKVPVPIRRENNVLVMEYISNNESPAPTMKDLPPDDPEYAIDWILDMVKKCYNDAELVHGDLSEYNILCGQEGYCIIDVSQGVPIQHPMAEELLIRDVFNIIKYFKKHRVIRDLKEELMNIKG